jgi:hypothetical protein
VALQHLQRGDPIRRFDQVIGTATRSIAPGRSPSTGSRLPGKIAALPRIALSVSKGHLTLLI